MEKKSQFAPVRFALAMGVGLFAAAGSGHAQGVVATISDVPVSGGFDYTILLQNTGSTSINSFWYGWVQFFNDLPSNPSGAGNTLGWNNNLDGNSIQWVNNTGTVLTPGNTGTFTFFSADTPAAITTSPAGESVAYVGGIDFSQGATGDSTGIFSPTLVPEPSPAAMLALGSLALLAFRRRSYFGVRFQNCEVIPAARPETRPRATRLP